MAEQSQILLIEDNAADAELTLEAFKQSRSPLIVNVVRNGVEALSYLRHEGEFSASIPPKLILLDLSLPCKDGHDVLAELKTDPRLMSIPVIVLTTSRNPRDISAAYKSHANCYIRKPLDFDRFLAIIEAIESFWLEIVELPAKEETR